MKLKASVAVTALAISLSAGAGARAETCRCAHQPAQRAAPLPVVVEEYYPHSDRSPAPVNVGYAPPAPPSGDYGFDDFDYDEQDLAYAAPYVGDYGFWPDQFSGDGRHRGGGHSRVPAGRTGAGRR